MNIKKTSEIEYKVFKGRDLYNIANYFVKVKKELNNEDTVFRLDIDFEDGSSIGGYDTSILDETETKIVRFIRFRLYNYFLKKTMTIHMTTKGGRYEVESEDRDWIDAKFSQLEEIFKSTPNQNYWFSNFKRQALINNIIGLTLGILVYFIILKKLFDEKVFENVFAYFIIILGSMAIGQISVYFSMENLYKLYPTIEFDTTSDHLNKNKKRKATIRSFFLLVILPLTLSFLF